MEIPTDLVDTMAAPTDLVEQNQQGTEAILEDLTTRMTQALRQSLNQTPAVTYDTAAPIAIKLNGTNYALWSQIVEMYISGKDKLGYINGDLPQPELNDPTFRRWRTENSIVKGWLINSMDPSLVGNFIRFPTAKQVWESIATTYFDGNDKSQVYDLKRRVTRMKQNGESIEGYYNCLQGLWREIDYRRPNPMECAIDVQRHNTLLQEDRVYVFLDGLDDRLDKIRSDVLQLQLFPSVEQAYAYVRREDIRQSVMLETNGGPIASVMATKSGKQNQMLRMTKRAPGYAATGGSKNLSGGLGCSHCGNAKHTRETCFKLHGYPEWWNEFKAKKSQEANGGVGRAAIAHAEPTLSLIPCVETKAETASNGSDQGKGCCYTISALVVSTKQKDDDWIVDSGATDHMTYNPDDLDEYITPRRNNISNANGVLYPVTGAGTVQLSPSISLTNTLLVPSLTTKLISVGQATEDLNCIVLMYPHFCLFQDILTKKIIGRGNKEMGILPIHADEERDIRAVINVEREDDDDATGTPSEDMETKRAATVEEEMGVSVDMGEEDLIADLAVDTGDKEAEMESETEHTSSRYTIPAGWIVMVCPPAVHMNPKQYDDPFTFNPWRWQGQELNAGSQKFMGFGGGSRLCAGAEFSKLQMAIFLHHLVTKYRWRVIKGGDIIRIPAVIFPNGFHIQILEKNIQKDATTTGSRETVYHESGHHTALLITSPSSLATMNRDVNNLDILGQVATEPVHSLKEEEEGREEMSDPNKPTSSGQGYGVSSSSSFANLPPPRGKAKNNLVKGLFSSSSSLSGKK
ncbi:hypothetical protein POTOM_027442 [Populus tomentosa]|uniref:Retrotransposon Copia-like N-terminal domain-containing protein n=1 Tax=Populus tomentosa TaxID=118781 RepID=A0A8X7ZG85_POPTO|nr:hypothetical protein POTOM_027442 [Populus tomentosa]